MSETATTDVETPTPNIELLDKTMEYIDTHPDEWEQDSWVCESGMCFAGHAAVTFGGGTFIKSALRTYRGIDGSRVTVAEDPYLAPTPDDPISSVRQYWDTPAYVVISDRAERLLGLTTDQAEELFNANNTLERLHLLVDAIKAGKTDLSDIPGPSDDEDDD